MAPRTRAVAKAALALGTGLASAYDYEDIVPRYCNEAEDWGALPPKPDGATELLQAQVFVRHGARVQGNAAKFCWEHALEEGEFHCELSLLENSVVAQRPLTPNFRMVYAGGRNGIPGNCGSGQLSQDGFQMHVNNGIRLREAYIQREHLLPETLEGFDLASVGSVFSLRSTDVPRTKQSGMALFSGLYGPSEIGSLPYVPLKSVDQALETMTVNNKVCPAVDAAATQYFRSLPEPSVRELRALCAWLNPSVPDEPQACLWWLDHLLDCIMSRTCPTVPFTPLNATVPLIFELEFGANLLRRVWRIVDEVSFGYFAAMAEVGAFGTVAQEAYSAAMRAARPEGSPVPRLLLWSGHDTGPMEPLMAALQLRRSPPFRPEFGSMLVLELWNSSSGVLARWIDNSQVVAGPMPLSEFQDSFGKLAASQAKCHSGDKLPAVEHDGIAGIAAFGMLPISVFGAVNLVFAAGIFYHVWQKKDRSLRLLR